MQISNHLVFAMRIRPRNVSRVSRAPRKPPAVTPGEPVRGCGALRCLDSMGVQPAQSFCPAHERASASVFNLFGSFVEPLPVASLAPVLVPVRTCMGPANTLFSLYGNVTVRRGNRSRLSGAFVFTSLEPHPHLGTQGPGGLHGRGGRGQATRNGQRRGALSSVRQPNAHGR